VSDASRFLIGLVRGSIIVVRWASWLSCPGACVCDWRYRAGGSRGEPSAPDRRLAHRCSGSGPPASARDLADAGVRFNFRGPRGRVGVDGRRGGSRHSNRAATRSALAHLLRVFPRPWWAPMEIMYNPQLQTARGW